MTRKRQINTNWNVVVVPDGTLEEAQAAAVRARRLVARWILRNSRNEKGNLGKYREVNPEIEFRGSK